MCSDSPIVAADVREVDRCQAELVAYAWQRFSYGVRRGAGALHQRVRRCNRTAQTLWRINRTRSPRSRSGYLALRPLLAGFDLPLDPGLAGGNFGFDPAADSGDAADDGAGQLEAGVDDEIDGLGDR